MAQRKSTKTVNDTTVTELIKPRVQFKEELQERIRKGEEIYNRGNEVTSDNINRNNDYYQWNDYNLELLKQSFNKPNNEYRTSYDRAGELNAVVAWRIGAPRSTPQEVHQEFQAKIKAKLDNLEALEQKIDLLKAPMSEITKINTDKAFNLNEVFIVHGHDTSAKMEVTRFIEKLGFKAIILHEQASSGTTIIEKIEQYSNVGFGIVLYTPCDVGAVKGKENHLRERARQNVVFEHGYLIGKIGRKNVCALVKGDVETPTDISGVVYVAMSGSWEIAIAKELRSSGYNVNMNLVI